jgi:hypothetical protein
MANKIIGIAVLIVVYLIVALLPFAGLDWPVKAVMGLFAFLVLIVVGIPWAAAKVAEFIADNAVYLTFVVVGWTAWVSVCVLLYIAAEWLITNLRGRAKG